VTSVALHSSACKSEEVAAYLDGELDASACTQFEQHLRLCPSCAEQLREQKRLLCALDFALGNESAQPLPPANFARVVAAHAQSDMSGVRAHSEHKRALWLCAMLAGASALLIGAAALSESVITPLRAVTKPLAMIVGFFWHTIYNAGASVVVISRVSGHVLFESRPLGVVGALLLVAALGLLPLLIVNYHRARIN
jgi:predicted anti-sigma-YlaC factor YlaD